MLEFDKATFAKLLRTALPKKTVVDEPTFSPYIQSVLNTLKDPDAELDLTKIDWTAFELSDVTPKGYEKMYPRVNEGWLKTFIAFCKKAPPHQLQKRSFF